MDTAPTGRRPCRRPDRGTPLNYSTSVSSTGSSERSREYCNGSQHLPEQGEIQDLLRTILRNGQDPNRQQVENILLVGLPGVGKSSLLCTLNAALTGKYIPWLAHGHGRRQTNTTTLTRFESCGVRQCDALGNENEILRVIQPTLPHYWDFIGLENENVDASREVLSLVIHGYIPPDTDCTALQELQRQHREDSPDVLRLMFREQNPDWIIQKIVFVHSCRVGVPYNLIDCLLSVVNETDPSTATRRYKGDLFVVMTKQDLAANEISDTDSIEVINATSADEPVTQPPDNPASSEHVDDDIEQQIAAKFNILGSLKFSLVRLTNYSDRTGFDYNPDIVKRHLKFLCQMTTPKLRKSKPKVVLTEEVQRLLFMRKIRRIIEEQIQMDIRKAFALLFLAYLAYLFLCRLFSSPSR